MAHLLTQPHQNYHHYHSELSDIELNGSLTTMELKKTHPFTLVGGLETQNGLVSHPRVEDKH